MSDIDMDWKARPRSGTPVAPLAVVSMNPPDVRKVTVTMYAGAVPHTQLTSTVHGAGTGKAEAEQMSDFENRLRAVETAVTRIDERVKHMPTTVQVGLMAVALGGAMWAVVQFAGPGVVKSAFHAFERERAAEQARMPAPAPPAN